MASCHIIRDHPELGVTVNTLREQRMGLTLSPKQCNLPTTPTHRQDKLDDHGTLERLTQCYESILRSEETRKSRTIINIKPVCLVIRRPCA